MKIKAYIRLQRCTTNDRHAFVARGCEYHGIAKGHVDYWAVEAASWAGIRRVLKTCAVLGHTNCSQRTVCAYVLDIGQAQPKLAKLAEKDVPPAARWNVAWKDESEAPELTSFSADAEIRPSLP